MFRFSLFLILLIVLPDLFIWWHFTRLHPGVWRTLLLLAPTLLSLACLGLLLCHVRVPQLMQVAFVLLICISIPKLVFVLTALTGKALGLALPAAETPTVRIGMWLAVLTAAIQIYGSVWG